MRSEATPSELLGMCTAGTPVVLGASPLQASLEGALWVARAVRSRMTLSKPRALAQIVLRYFPEAAWVALFHANFQQQKVICLDAPAQQLLCGICLLLV
jgi:hypothetical protein